MNDPILPYVCLEEEEMEKEEIRRLIPEVLVNRVIWCLPMTITKVYYELVNQRIVDTPLLAVDDKMIIHRCLRGIAQIWWGESTLDEVTQTTLKERYLTILESHYAIESFLTEEDWTVLIEMMLSDKLRRLMIKGLSHYLRMQEEEVLSPHLENLPSSLSQWYIRCNRLIRYLSVYTLEEE